MRFLLIHQVFLSPKAGGGTRHFEFGRYTVQQGHDFAVVASDVGYLDGKRIETAENPEIVEGIEVHRARMLQALHRSFIWRVFAFVSFMVTATIKALRAGKVDVVMGTSPPLFQATSAWFVAAIRRKPFLLEVRDLWPDFAIDMGVLTNPVLIWLARRLEIFLYKRATHILVNSPAYREYLIEKRGISTEKISLISNGVAPDMFDPQEKGAAIREEFDLQEKFVVTYAGAMGPANDIQTIIRAAELLKGTPQVHFLLVGDGKDRSKSVALSQELQLTNVTFAGLRPKSEMNQILGASDACVATLMNIPMFNTTYPNKVFDYMAAAKPVVLGIDGVIRDVVEQADAGIFVQPGDAGALAKAVDQLAANTEQAVTMGRQGRDYVIKHFNRKQHAQEFLDLLERLA